MIKARGTLDGGEFVLLGLSFANLDRLRAGSPIKFDGRPYGIPMYVIIVADETVAKIAAGLAQPDTSIIPEESDPGGSRVFNRRNR